MKSDQRTVSAESVLRDIVAESARAASAWIGRAEISRSDSLRLAGRIPIIRSQFTEFSVKRGKLSGITVIKLSPPGQFSC